MELVIFFITLITLSVSTINWQWQENDGSWKDYSDWENIKIETAYQNNEASVQTFHHLTIYFHPRPIQWSSRTGVSRYIRRIDTQQQQQHSFKWEFQQINGIWKPYVDAENIKLENAFKNNEKDIQINDRIIYFKDHYGRDYNPFFIQINLRSGERHMVRRIAIDFKTYVNINKIHWNDQKEQKTQVIDNNNDYSIRDLIILSGWEIPQSPNKVQLDGQDIWDINIKINFITKQKKNNQIQITLMEIFYPINFHIYRDVNFNHLLQSGSLFATKSGTVAQLKNSIHTNIDLRGYDAFSVHLFGGINHVFPDTSTMQQMYIFPWHNNIYFAPKRNNDGNNEDPYQLLGVARNAPLPEITKAFHKLAKELHPDRNVAAGDKEDEREAKFKEISAAYDILKDPEKRKQYDQNNPSQ